VVSPTRSHLVTSNGIGSGPVHIKSGAMVADRVVMLFDVELGESSMLGSRAFNTRNGHYAPSTIWVGAKNREALCLTAEFSSPALKSYQSDRRWDLAN
jgi:acetyltransferase-like isoleucine patch superfamily enzyme